MQVFPSLVGSLALTALLASPTLAQEVKPAAYGKGETATATVAFTTLPETLTVAGSFSRVNLTAVEGEEGVMAGTLEVDGEEIPIRAVFGDDLTAVKVKIGEKEITSGEGTARGNRKSWGMDGSLMLNGKSFSLGGITRGMGRDQKETTTLSMSQGPLYGTVKVAGKDMHIALLDGNGDGKVQGAEDRWLLLDDATLATFNQNGRNGVKSFNKNSMTRADHPVFLGADQAVYLASSSDGEVKLSIRAPEHGLSHYLHQRAKDINDNFSSDLSRFIEDGRELAKTPIDWTYALELEPLLARAKKEGKPLFIDFETDWCGWCHILDKVTYPDAEVAKFITENYIPVKWNCELDPKAIYRDFGVRGFPGMVLVSPQGEKIGNIGGFSPPSKFIEKLQEMQENAGKAGEEDGDK